MPLLGFQMSFEALKTLLRSSRNDAKTMTTYSPLSEPERDSEYSNDTATPFAHNEKALLRTKPHSWLWVLQGALLLCSTTILILAYQRPVQDAECVKQLFGYCKFPHLR
jgi:hypothetical protein